MAPDTAQLAQDTVFAAATAPGRGAIAVIRVSGAEAVAGLQALTGAGDTAPPPPRRAVLWRLTDPVSRETLDDALVLYFQAPHSFTGEDVVEYHLHGGRAVVEGMLEALRHMPGHRPAEPGEFTRRAFENGKTDLTAAEAINDLIAAETEAQRTQALNQMHGSLARLYEGWAARLTRALALVEAEIDFPEEEDIPERLARSVYPELETIRQEIAAHLQDNRRGERLREGLQVAVIGAPNAGKSTLVNTLAQRDVAIVADVPGTTRDVLEVHLDLGGMPVILIDTAGLRPETLIAGDAQGAIESEGIRRARERATQADLRLLVFDGTTETPDPGTLECARGPGIMIVNKCDSAPPQAAEKLSNSLRDPVFLSASQGHGVDALLEKLDAALRDILGDSTRPSPTRERHRAALGSALDQIHEAVNKPGQELEMMAENLRLAVRFIGRITGRVDVEDLLDIVFREFCLGK